MQGGEADVVPEQEEAVAQVDGKAQVFGGGPNSASAIAMLLSSQTVLCDALQLCHCVSCCHRAQEARNLLIARGLHLEYLRTPVWNI